MDGLQSYPSHEVLTVGTDVTRFTTATGNTCEKAHAFQADLANTGTIYIGYTTSVSSSSYAYALLAGDSVRIAVDDLSKIYFIASAASQLLARSKE